MTTSRRLALALAVSALAVAAAALRLRPPAPLGPDAAATSFSAARALEVLRALAPGDAPRPPGSPANLRMVGAIVARLGALGLAPEVQDAFGCGIYGTCARVRNVVAQVGAAPPGRRAVLVVAHHDSVGAGPGVSDDLAGVAAILELARALRAGAPLPRPVILLLTDAEEAGLVGASTFAAEHRWARSIGAVVNLEARGTTGPSLLFDTVGEPAWIGPVARAMPRPATQSLASAIYHLLPNDTDLTAFAQAGFGGVDLAFAGGAARYHTPRDDLAHLDPRSLQHQGENALALVRAAAAEDLERPARGERAWLDLLGATVVAWPRPREAALAAGLVALAGVALALRRAARPVRALGLGAAAALVAPLLAAAAALAAFLALRGAALSRPFVASPGAWELAGWFAGAAGAFAAPALFGRGAGRDGLAAGQALLAGLASAALGLLSPAATPVAAVPALAWGLALIARATLRGRGGAALGALPTLVAPLVLAPAALALPLAAGAPAVLVSAALAALALSPASSGAAELTGRSRAALALAPLAVVALLAAVQARRPHATADAPEPLTLAFHESDGRARWLAESERDALPAALRAAAPFSARRGTPIEWLALRRGFEAPAPPAGLAPPAAQVLASDAGAGVRRVRLRLASRRGAATVLLVLPPWAAVRSAAIDGHRVPPVPPLVASLAFAGRRIVGCVTTPPEGFVVELELEGAGRVGATVTDVSPGLPPAAAPLVAARPATAVPRWDGDSTLATAPVRL